MKPETTEIISCPPNLLEIPRKIAETAVFHDENPPFFNQGAHAPTPRAGPFGPFSGGAIAGPSFASIKSASGMR